MDIIITNTATLVLLAVLCEAVTESLKDIVPSDLTPQAKRGMSLLVGLALAALLQISLFANATGSMYIAGIILAGLLCSRGANYVHDLAGMIAATKANIEQ